MIEGFEQKEGESAHDLFARIAQALYEQQGIIVERVDFGWSEAIGGPAHVAQTELQSMKR